MRRPSKRLLTRKRLQILLLESTAIVCGDDRMCLVMIVCVWRVILQIRWMASSSRRSPISSAGVSACSSVLFSLFWLLSQDSQASPTASCSVFLLRLSQASQTSSSVCLVARSVFLIGCVLIDSGRKRQQQIVSTSEVITNYSLLSKHAERLLSFRFVFVHSADQSMPIRNSERDTQRERSEYSERDTQREAASDGG